MENENGAMGNPFLNQPKQTPEGAIKFTDESAAPAPQPLKVPQSENPIVQTPIQSEAAVGTQVKYAGFWIRWAANFIDSLIIGIPIIIFSVVLGIILSNLPNRGSIIVSILLQLFLTAIGWIYFILMTKSYGATLGKKALGIKVISDKSEELSWGQVILRETVGKIISIIILYIGYIMAGFTQRKQALHDMIAGTVVVYKDPNKKPRGFIIGLIVGLVLVVPIIGILASIVLVSLSSARQKANDAAIKTSLSAQIPAAIIYYDDNNSFRGFKSAFQLNDTAKKCAGDPIVNVSTNGQAMAIFAKSCSKNTVYFCDDITSDPSYNGKVIEVDEQYAKSGAVSCNKVLNQAKADASGSAGTSSATDQANLPNTYQDDKLGFEIKYPSNWSQTKENDNKLGVTIVIFRGNKDNLSPAVTVEGAEIAKVLDSADIADFIKAVKTENAKEKGKFYDEKDFVYKFEDGTTAIGKEFKTEYTGEGVAYKQRTTLVPNGKKLIWFSYAADVNQYDNYSDIAAAMFDSWVMKK